jgi:hypothetical protein
VLLIWGAAVVWAMIDVGDSNDGGIEVIVGEK